MIRTQVSLTTEQLDKARREARRRGVSVAQVIRDALEQTIGDDDNSEVRKRAKIGVGGYRSGLTDTSESHDAALAENPRW